MTDSLYGKLAIERCKLHVAQLCAVAHLDKTAVETLGMQKDQLSVLLRGLSADLETLEAFIKPSEFE